MIICPVIARCRCVANHYHVHLMQAMRTSELSHLNPRENNTQIDDGNQISDLTDLVAIQNTLNLPIPIQQCVKC